MKGQAEENGKKRSFFTFFNSTFCPHGRIAVAFLEPLLKAAIAIVQDPVIHLTYVALKLDLLMKGVCVEVARFPIEKPQEIPLAFFSIAKLPAQEDQVHWEAVGVEGWTSCHLPDYLFVKLFGKDFVGVDTKDPVILCQGYGMSFLCAISIECSEIDGTAKFPADADRIVSAIAIQDENFVTPGQAGKRTTDITAFVVGYYNCADRQHVRWCNGAHR